MDVVGGGGGWWVVVVVMVLVMSRCPRSHGTQAFAKLDIKKQKEAIDKMKEKFGVQ